MVPPLKIFWDLREYGQAVFPDIKKGRAEHMLETYVSYGPYV